MSTTHAIVIAEEGPLEHVAYIQDGQCDEDLLTEDCCFDGGDCPCPECSCPTCFPLATGKGQWLGDNVCDDVLNTKACCFDLFDCPCNGCDVSTVGECSDDVGSSQTVGIIGNHHCDSCLNTPQCCFDMGDCLSLCLTCQVSYKHSALGDFICDLYMFNKDCCFDLGDCENSYTRCPSCDPFLFWDQSIGTALEVSEGTEQLLNTDKLCFSMRSVTRYFSQKSTNFF